MPHSFGSQEPGARAEDRRYRREWQNSDGSCQDQLVIHQVHLTEARVDSRAALDFKTKVCFLRQKFGLQGVALLEFGLDKAVQSTY